MAHIPRNNFTAGELSPQLDARVDLDRYASGCATMENFRPLPWGGATFRPGTLFKQEVKYSERATRLIPFNYSTTQSFILEFGHLYIRFYDAQTEEAIQFPIGTAPAWVTATGYVAGDRVTKDGLSYICLANHTSGTFATDLAAGKWEYAPYEITTVFTETELFDVHFKELNDVVYLAHPDHPQQKLSRIADDNWTIADVTWTRPAVLDENTTTTTLAVAATTGATTLTASTSIFNSSMVGGYFQLRHRVAAQNLSFPSSATGNSSNVTLSGTITILTYGTWAGSVTIERQDAAGSWQAVRSYSGNSDFNASDSYEEGDTEGVYRVNWTRTSGTIRVVLSCAAYDVYGSVKVTGYTSGTVLNVTVTNTVKSTSATLYWAEGAWSAYRGYPRTVGVREQRLCFASTTHQKTRVWESVTGDLENFLIGQDADDALSYDVVSAMQNPVEWAEALDTLHLGTTGNEIATGSGSTGDPVTPSNIAARATSNFGSARMQPVNIDRKIIFLERQQRRLREIGESYIYGSPDDSSAPDLTVMAEHILRSGIRQMDVARLPDAMLYLVRNDGQIAVLTYNREHKINAWARFVTNGQFESVACVYSDPQDKVWVVVNRTMEDGTTKRYVERFVTFYNPDEPSADFLGGPLTFKLPCTGTLGGGLCSASATPVVTSVKIGGDTATTYNLRLRIAGVAEGNSSYTGGTAGPGGLYTGGADGGLGINIYKIVVSDPAQTFFLNNGSGVQAWDYLATIPAKGGATLTLTADASDAQQAENTAALTVSNIPGVEQPYDGQFMQVQFQASSPTEALPVDTAALTFLDCSINVSNSTPSTTVSGLDHLEGEEVGVVADGLYVGTFTVSGGSVTLSTPATNVAAGLLYEGTLETMKIDAMGTQGRKRRIKKITVRYKDSAGGVINVPGTAQDEPINPDNTSIETGEWQGTWPGGIEHNVTVKIQQLEPLPLTIIALLPEMDVLEP